MKTIERTRRPDIKSLTYLVSGNIVECAKGQVFYETPKSYEIWFEEPLFRVYRISRKVIGWVNTF